MPRLRALTPLDDPLPMPEPTESLLALRRDFRMASISQFVNLFKRHCALSFNIEDLELDLDGARPLSCVPTLLGKLLNTLANDRNVNASNWQTALRRQYNRRQRDHNPFVRWVRLGKPGDVTSASVPVASTSAAVVAEPVPKLEPSAPGDGEEDGQPTLADEYDDEKTYWDTVDVDWLDVDIETKIEAIYNVCEWHMVDADKFRRQLKVDVDFSWNIEPIGYDSSQNAYYYFDDSRLWIKRSLPLKLTLNLKKRKLSPAAAGEQAKRPRPASKRDGWEEIPEALLKEWEAPAPVAGSSRASSALTSLDGAEHDEHARTGEDRMQVEQDVHDRAPEKDESVQELDEDKDGWMPWERDYWAERERMLNEPGFVEWEAVCITVAEYEAFVQRFAKSKDRQEKALRDLIANDILPVVVEHYAALERERAAELAQLNRKRSSRLASLESAQEDDARIAAEQAELLARASRASRHRVIVPTVPEDADGSTNGAVLGGDLGRGESREERLRKREEEKYAREAAIELAEIEEAKAIARAEAIAANGGVVPPGMETPEELARMAEQAEKERKKREREEKRLQKEADVKQARLAKKHERAARIAALKAAAPPPEPEHEDEPWYLDCEVCHKAGWNLDDGSDVISCDRCEEWQHLDCHIKADSAAGRPRIDYAKASFVCSRCKANPERGPQGRVAPARGRAPAPVLAAGPPAKPKRQHKAKPQPTGPDGLPIPKPARAPARQRGSLPTATPSARQASPRNSTASKSPTVVEPAAAAQPTPAATGIPGPGQPPLDYPSLLALIKANPVLVNQLPAEYQKHFGTLLKIPIPYPADFEALAAQPQPNPVAAPVVVQPQQHPAPAPVIEPKPVVAQPAPAAVAQPTPAAVEQKPTAFVDSTPIVVEEKLVVGPTPVAVEPTTPAPSNGHAPALPKPEPEAVLMGGLKAVAGENDVPDTDVVMQS